MLVRVFDETLYEHHAPFHTKKVDEYLDEQGCGFAVCFTLVDRGRFNSEGLYAAGVQKIIDEYNRQYEVYKNEKV